MNFLLKPFIIGIVFFLAYYAEEALAIDLKLENSAHVKKNIGKQNNSRPHNTSIKLNSKQFTAGDTILTGNGQKGFCPGGSIQLTASPTPQGATYQWYINGALINGANTYTYTAIFSGTYTVIVTTGGVPDSYPPIIITDFALPQVFIAHTPEGQCTSIPITFVNNTNTNGAKNVTYLWDFGDGTTSTDPSHLITHQFIGDQKLAAQTFNVKLTATTENGCSATSPIDVVHTIQPSAFLDGTQASTNNTFKACSEASSALFTFSNASTTKTSNSNYAIDWGDGSAPYTSTSFSSPLTHTYNKGSYVLKFTVTGNNGCVNAANYTVFVGTNPAVGLGNPGDTYICAGQTLTFPITGAENNGDATTYIISFSDGTTVGPIAHKDLPKSISHTFNIGSCGYTSTNGPTIFQNSFSASIKATNPCSTSGASVVPIYVSQKPVVTAAFSVDTACIGTPITFTNTSASSSGVSTSGVCTSGKSVWSLLGADGLPPTGYTIVSGIMGNEGFSYNGWTGGSTNLQLNFQKGGTYSIKLKTFTGNTNCGLDSVVKTICVNPTPTATYTVDNTTGCLPLVVKTTNTSSQPNCGNNRYLWKITYSNNGCSSGTSGYIFLNGTSATSVNPQIQFNNPGIYSLSLTTTAPGGSCTAISQITIITVKAKPVVNLTANGTICQGANFTPTATATSCYSVAAPTYLWTITGGTPATSTSLNPGTIVYQQAGTYTLTLDVTNDCGTTTVTKQITVNAAPTVTVPASQLLCNGDASGILSFTGSSGATFNWTNSNTAIGLAASGTGNIASFTAKNVGATPLVATITVTANNGCASNSSTFTITVNPKPVVNPVADKIFCNNTPVSTFAFTSTPAANTSFTWKNDNTSIGLDTAGAGNLPAFTAIDTSKIPQVANVTVKPVYTGGVTNCPVTAVTFKITVLPTITISAIKSHAFCAATVVPAVVPVNDAGTFAGSTVSYSWAVSGPDIGLSAGTGLQVPSFTAKNTGNTDLIDVITITPIYKYSNLTCAGKSISYSDTIHPAGPVAITGGTIRLCSQTQTGLNGADPGTGGVGTWTDTAPGSTLIFSPDAHAYNATVSNLNPGTTYNLKWTIAGSNCGLSSAPLVIIDDLPPTNNQISPVVTTVCSGQAVTITGTKPAGGAGAYRYRWESTTDTLSNSWKYVDSLNQNLTLSNLQQSAYYRRIIYSGSCSLISGSVHIIVLPPIANNIILSDQQICPGNTIAALTGNLPNGGNGIYHYQWQTSTDNIAWADTAPQDTLAGYQPGILPTDTYFRRLVTSAMCAGAQKNASNSVKITLSPNAKAEFTASVLQGCVPFDLKKAITIVAHSDVNADYQWYANNTLIGTGATFPAYSINTDGVSQTIKLVAISKSGCSKDSMSLTFSTSKRVVASFTKDQVIGCGPMPVNLVNTSAPIGGATYAWDFGDGRTSVLPQPGTITYQPNPLGRDTTFIITLKATSGCSVTTFIDSVRVRSNPRAIFSPDKTIGCSPFTVKVSNQSRGLYNKYTFSFGNGDPQEVKTDKTTFSHTFTTLKTDTLTLKLVAENDCGKDSSYYKIVIYPNNIQANLIVNGDNKFGCAPLTVNFFNNTVGANTFQYDFGDGSTPIQTNTVPETIQHTFNNKGIYTVKLTASNGCSTQTATQLITVLDQPQVSFSTLRTQYCIGDTVAFLNTSASPALYSYQWDFGDNNNNSADINQLSPKHVYTKAGTITVKLTVFQNQANGLTCSKTTTQVITILPLPDATFASNAATLNCAPFKLTVSNKQVNSTGVAWDFGDAGSAGNIASGYTATHIFTKSGLYRVKLSAFNQNSCSDSTVQMVRVTEAPKAQFSTADTILCGNTATVSFKNETTYGGNDPVSYLWYVNNNANNVGVQKSLTYTFTAPPGALLPYTFRVKLLAYSTIGCPDTVVHTITLNPVPLTRFSAASAIGCAPFHLIISNTSQYASHYKWYINGALVDTNQIPSIILKNSNKIYSLKLVTSNDYACRADSLTKSVSTYPKPVAAFTVADSVSCTGSLDVVLNNKTAGATSYIWNFGDQTPLQTTATPAIHHYTAGNWTISLVASNGVCSDTITHQVNIAKPPKAAFIASAVKGCGNLSVVFQNTSVYSTHYKWDFGDKDLTDNTVASPTHNYTYTHSPFTVKLIAYGDYGCADTTVLVNYINVSAPPVADFNVVPDTVIQIPNHTFSFNNTTTGPAVSYAWDFGDTKTSTDKNPIHLYPNIGYYSVKLTATNADGCSTVKTRTVRVADIPQYIYVPNAFEPASLKTDLRVFSVRAAGLASFSMRIFNLWGQLVYETNALDNKGVPTGSWDGLVNGRPADLGVFVWQINAHFLDGSEWKGMKYKSGDTPSQTGILHLIR